MTRVLKDRKCDHFFRAFNGDATSIAWIHETGAQEEYTQYKDEKCRSKLFTEEIKKLQKDQRCYDVERLSSDIDGAVAFLQDVKQIIHHENAATYEVRKAVRWYLSKIEKAQNKQPLVEAIDDYGDVYKSKLPVKFGDMMAQISVSHRA